MGQFKGPLKHLGYVLDGRNIGRSDCVLINYTLNLIYHSFAAGKILNHLHSSRNEF